MQWSKLFGASRFILVLTTMGLHNRDLILLLLVTLVALLSYQWEGSFNFETLDTIPVSTTSKTASFTNMYGCSISFSRLIYLGTLILISIYS